MNTAELFDRLALAGVRRDLYRNIVSLRSSQDLFDDLSDDPAEWALAQKVEGDAKPPPFRSPTPVLHRPFEDAAWFNAIDWPFRNWQASRFSDGGHGVWYGAESVDTTVYESAWHWRMGLLADAGFERESVVAERKVYLVGCDAALLDFRPLTGDWPALLHPSDYRFPQSVGARIHREGHPGLVIQSVRRPAGENYAVFNPAVLSSPRHHLQLSYRLDGHCIVVEKTPGVVWFGIDASDFGAAAGH